VRSSIDDQPTTATDAFATVMVERYGFFILLDKLIVEHVEHFEKRRIAWNIRDGVRDEPSRILFVLLPPNVERELHYL
jgi:hypothetical protein